MESDNRIGACGAAEHPYDATLKSYRKTEETDWIGCGAVLLRMCAVKDVSFFDRNYFMYNEDIDLSLRLVFAGWKIYYHPSAVWHHNGWKRMVKWNDFRRFHSAVSRAYLLVKFASCGLLFHSVKSCLQWNKQAGVTVTVETKKSVGMRNRLLFFSSVIFNVILKLPAGLKNRFVVRRLNAFNQLYADELLRKTG